MSKLCMQYSRIDASNQMLIFNALFHMMGYLQATDDHSYFDKCIKKMYMEFTKESKTGGGGHSVQITLRVAQNCFVELLGLNLPSAYQLGFLYIRQLCLHLRNARHNMSADQVKSLYSWQLFNCMKLWVLAVCQHKSELVLLIHPLVQLMTASIRISGNIKYLPFHLKIINLLNLINEKTGEFVPICQHIL